MKSNIYFHFLSHLSISKSNIEGKKKHMKKKLEEKHFKMKSVKAKYFFPKNVFCDPFFFFAQIYLRWVLCSLLREEIYESLFCFSKQAKNSYFLLSVIIFFTFRRYTHVPFNSSIWNLTDYFVVINNSSILREINKKKKKGKAERKTRHTNEFKRKT